MLVTPDHRIKEYIDEISQPGIPYVNTSHNTLRRLGNRYGYSVIEDLIDTHWEAQRILDTRVQQDYWLELSRAQQVLAARVRLTDFVMQRAADTEARIGIGYAPNTVGTKDYAELRHDYNVANIQRTPLPVYSGAADSTIYTSREGNWAFRFWHDVLHCELNADFSTEGENKVANTQCLECALVFGKDSLEFKLLQADTLGQVHYYNDKGGFVEDQLAYVLDLIKSGWTPDACA